MRPWLQISFSFYKVSNSDTLKPLIRVVETQGKTVNRQPNVCIQNMMRVKAGPISEIYQTYQHLQTSRKKIKANKAVFHDLLTLPKNETLTPNFSYKVSNSDKLKSQIKEKYGKL
jgi:hypothetical protein